MSKGEYEIDFGMFHLILTVLHGDYNRGVLYSLVRTVCKRGNIPSWDVSCFVMLAG